ncbi:Hypothetical protein A7982_06122 [Minicystis rosea]|nr:Hypothetical protein A7982_06122 [Minicystis rosea]
MTSSRRVDSSPAGREHARVRFLAIVGFVALTPQRGRDFDFDTWPIEAAA